MIAFCVLCAAVGAAVGSLLTKRVNHQDLRLARKQGIFQGRQEQAHRVAFLERRVVYLEACARSFTRGSEVKA